MDEKARRRALELLGEKAAGGGRTYGDIARETGYSERQLMRLARRLAVRGEEGAAAHGNSGRRPANAAGPGEVEYLRRLKEPYPSVTIAHFRDIFFEDVLENPARAGDVAEYGLVPRGASWFRDLFRAEGWESPAQRRPSREPSGRPHPLRPPLPRRGTMLQVDATPLDWLGTGEAWAMHLAVDDATTEVAGGWFMPAECTRGYARAMLQVVRRHGVPRSIYSDRDAVFRSARDGSPTQFAAMMSDLGVRMIFANSPQAKGRVERYNRTAQLRLPTDAVRFGVRGYDELNAWFNDFYAPYLNAKFSYAPRDPESDFSPCPPEDRLPLVFRTRERRVSRGAAISYGTVLYLMVDGDGVVVDPGDGREVSVYVDAVTEEVYAEAAGRRLALVPVGTREGRGPAGAQDRRDLQRVLGEMTREGAARMG
jgi:hypothetical protein